MKKVFLVSKLSYFIKKLFSFLFSSNGILTVLLIGMAANFITNTIQDVVQKQRYLELLQYEVRSNVLAYGGVLDDYEIDNNINLDHYLIDDVYKAGLSNGYIFSLQPDSQINLIVFYDSVRNYNSILRDIYSLKDRSSEEYFTCEIFNGENLCNKQAYEDQQSLFSQEIVNTWDSFFKLVEKNSQTFNPTSNRLSSIFLRLIMGGQSLEVQK